MTKDLKEVRASPAVGKTECMQKHKQTKKKTPRLQQVWPGTSRLKAVPHSVSDAASNMLMDGVKAHLAFKSRCTTFAFAKF